jgi:hypothetical protein
MLNAQRIAPVALLALCLVRLWLMPLPGSLWADETATFFVLHYGGGHPSLAVAPQVAQSVYYWLPWMAEMMNSTGASLSLRSSISGGGSRNASMVNSSM